MRGVRHHTLCCLTRAGHRSRQRPLSKERFRYDPTADAYHCPGGQLLDTRDRSVTRGHVSIQYSNPAACTACAIRKRCTGDRWRRINRWENEAVLERMAKRLAGRPDILGVPRKMVEHPFGSIKQWMNQGVFLMRGLDKVRAEFSLTALALISGAPPPSSASRA